MPFRRLRNETASPNLVLIGNFGAGNVGDELILAGFLCKLGKELPKAKVTVLGGDPRLVRRFHGVDALPHLPTGVRSFFKHGWWRSVKKIREADAVIFPGGGLFTDQESAHAIFLWGIHLLVARYFWKPVYLLGQSIGPIESEYMKDFTRFCLRKVEWIGVRDTASENELKKLGVSSVKIKHGNDSSFWLVNRVPKEKPLSKKGSKQRIKILVSLRSFPKIGDDFFAELAQALDEISEKFHARISFASFGKGDDEVWKKVCRSAKHSELWKKIELPESAEGVLKEIKNFDVVVGIRLHSIIAAKLVGVPAIAFAYSQKIDGFTKNPLRIEGFKKKTLLDLLK